MPCTCSDEGSGSDYSEGEGGGGKGKLLLRIKRERFAGPRDYLGRVLKVSVSVITFSKDHSLCFTLGKNNASFEEAIECYLSHCRVFY